MKSTFKWHAREWRDGWESQGDRLPVSVEMPDLTHIDISPMAIMGRAEETRHEFTNRKYVWMNKAGTVRADYSLWEGQKESSGRLVVLAPKGSLFYYDCQSQSSLRCESRMENGGSVMPQENWECAACRMEREECEALIEQERCWQEDEEGQTRF